MSYIAAQTVLTFFPAGVSAHQLADSNLATVLKVGPGDTSKILTVEAFFSAQRYTDMPGDFRGQLHTSDDVDGEAPDFGLQIVRLDAAAPGTISAASAPVSGAMRLHR